MHGGGGGREGVINLNNLADKQEIKVFDLHQEVGWGGTNCVCVCGGGGGGLPHPQYASVIYSRYWVSEC